MYLVSDRFYSDIKWLNKIDSNIKVVSSSNNWTFITSSLIKLG